jgi:hypothetical protein
MVLEDDIKYTVDVETVFAAIQELKAVGGCDVFFLGYCYAPHCTKSKFEQLGKYLFRASDNQWAPACNHALVLTRNFIVGYMETDHVTYWKDMNDLKLWGFIKANHVSRCVPPHTFVDQDRAKLGTHNENYDDGKGRRCTFQSKI